MFRLFFRTTILWVSAGCHGLLDVSDPTHIGDDDIANAGGANARRLAVSASLGYLYSVVRDVAIITDEWTIDYPATNIASRDPDAQLDQRNSELFEAASYGDNHLGPLDKIFLQTSLAIPEVRAYTPDSLKDDFLAQIYAVRGYVVLQMAEDLCSGFPLNDVVENLAVYGGPLTTDSAVAFASAQLDSAIKYGHDSARVITLARVVKGRALLDQGKYSEANAVVASVPTTSVYLTEQSGPNIYMDTYWCIGCEMFGVGNREGGSGQPFVSANDPRVPLALLGPRNTDPNDTLYITTKGSSPNDRLMLASGVEARLIQAEVAAHTGAGWKPILDSLRTTVGLAPLNDPGNLYGRIDIVYSERAFWLYMTGRRLGDVRRLVKNYGRSPETVFPTGAYHGGDGGTYGTATSIPFILADQAPYNPNITSGCTNR